MNLSHLATLAYDEFMIREGIRKGIYQVVEKSDCSPVTITIKGKWIIDNHLDKALISLFPDRFQGGIKAGDSYEFNPQEAEFAGLITEA